MKQLRLTLRSTFFIVLAVAPALTLLLLPRQSSATPLAVTGDTFIEQITTASQSPTAASALGTAFTYQAQFTESGNPAEGAYDFRFRLYDAPTSGNQIGTTVALDDVTVVSGLFTAELDFGLGAFDGDGRYLAIEVRDGPSTNPADYVLLTPRRKLTPAPYALYAEQAGQAAVAETVESVSILSAPDGNPANALFINNDGSASLPSTVDVSKTNRSGALVIGPSTGNNVGIDSNEIMARQNTDMAPLTVVGSNLFLRGLDVDFGVYSVTRDGSGGTSRRTMTPATEIFEGEEYFNSFCALSRVTMHDVDDGEEFATCRVVRSGNSWELQATLNKDEDHAVTCEAMCIVFGGQGR